MSDPVQPPVFSGDVPGEPRAPGARADSRERRRGARYGASLVAVVLGVYLVLQWQPGPLLGVGAVEPLLAAQIVIQLVLGALLLAGGLAIAPASPIRTVPMALLAVVVIPLAALIVHLRVTGALPGRPIWLWTLLTPGMAALGVAILGWLVVRGRSPFLYVLALGAAIPALVRFGLLLAGVPTPFIWYTDLLLSLVVGVGAAWIAAGAARLMRGSSM